MSTPTAPSLGRLAALLSLAKEGRASSADWIDVFRAGQHRDADHPWTVADLDTIVANFAANAAIYTPPLVLGHEESQEWLQDTGLPKAGDVVEVRRNGDTLQAKFAGVPKQIAECINHGLYDAVSVEIWPEPDGGLQGAGPTLRRIALLGGWPPQVKGLGKLPAMAAGSRARAQRAKFLPRGAGRILGGSAGRSVGGSAGNAQLLTRPRTLRQTRLVHGDRGRVLIYSELVMDQATKDTLIAVIKGKWSDLPDEFLAGLDDAGLQSLASAATPAGDGAGGNGGTGDEFADGAASREQMIADLVGMGEDQATLDTLDNAALEALWTEKKGTAMGSTGSTKRGTVAKHGSAGTFTAAQVDAMISRAVATAIPAAVAKAVAAHVKPVAATVQRIDKFASDTLAAQKKARVKAELDTLVQQGRVLPAEIDGGLADVLLQTDATTVHKYASADAAGKAITVEQTPFDRMLNTLKARPVIAKFADRFTDPVKAVDADAEVAKVKRYADTAAFASTLKAAGKSPEKYVEQFKKLREKNPSLTAREYGVPADA